MLVHRLVRGPRETGTITRMRADLMDVPKILRRAREKAGLSQRRLAERAGTTQPVIAGYESGANSPTVRTLNKLLAAMDLQLRVTIEPLLADVDARLDEALASTPMVPVERLQLLAKTLDDDEDADVFFGRHNRPTREGPATWAVDGVTALQLHGWGVPGEFVSVAVVWNAAAPSWSYSVMLQNLGRRGALSLPTLLDMSLEEVVQQLNGECHCVVGLVTVRFVDELPATLLVHVDGVDRPVRTLTLEAVAQAHPEHRDLLDRWHQRQAA